MPGIVANAGIRRATLGCMLVVDTSEFSAIPDYRALKAKGAKALIPRVASGRAHVDAKVDRHVEAALAAGLRCDVGYGYVRSSQPGDEQADFMSAECGKRGLLLFADTEPVYGAKVATDAPAVARLVVAAFLRRWLGARGVRCGVYGPAAYVDALNLDPDLCGPLWTAHAEVSRPMHSRPWGGAHVLHQYELDAYGEAPGAKVDWSQTDLDYAELLACLRAGAWSPPPPSEKSDPPVTPCSPR